MLVEPSSTQHPTALDPTDFSGVPAPDQTAIRQPSWEDPGTLDGGWLGEVVRQSTGRWQSESGVVRQRAEECGAAALHAVCS